MTREFQILVIDDNPADAEFLRILFNSMSSRMIESRHISSPDELKKEYDIFRYDVVFVDYQLDDIDGLEVIKGFRRKGYSGFIVLLTGYGNEDVVISALRSGVNDYIAKNLISLETLERTFRFIEEKMKSDDILRQLDVQLMNTQKMESLGVLAGGIAHDFNNILMAVLGNAELGLMTSKKGSQSVGYFSNIKKATETATQLCNQLLVYSGKATFVLESIHMNDLIRNLLSVLEVSVLKKITVTYHLDKHLPFVVADASQIQQLILNLVTNAADSMGKKSGEIKVSTSVVSVDRAYLSECFSRGNITEGDYVCIQVSDNGCGMTPEVMEKVFDPFFTSKFTGRGLGLAAVLGIVKGHNGAIKIESQLDKGTTFSIILPKTNEQPTELIDSDEIADTQIECSILVVDDDMMVLNTCTDMLKQFVGDVQKEADPMKAIEFFKEHHKQLDLVMLDFMMPQMDGEELIEIFHSIDKDVPVLLMSGYNQNSLTPSMQFSNFSGFIQKPFNFQKMVSLIHRTLKNTSNTK